MIYRGGLGVTGAGLRALEALGCDEGNWGCWGVTGRHWEGDWGYWEAAGMYLGGTWGYWSLVSGR